MRNQGRQNAEAVAYLMRRISEGEDPRAISNEAGRLIGSINPADIASAEHNLMDMGLPAKTVRQLSAAFLFIGMHAQNRTTQATLLPPGHLLRKVMAEHDIIRCLIADLQEVTSEISIMTEMSDACSEFRRLTHIIAHLDNTREHIDREEHVIFPYLRKYGWPGLYHPAQCDHLVIVSEIDNLVRLVAAFYEAPLEQFRDWLISITGRLSTRMLEHLSYEDDVLHPIATAVIDDPGVWEKMKAICEDIGYCGIYH